MSSCSNRILFSLLVPEVDFIVSNRIFRMEFLSRFPRGTLPATELSYPSLSTLSVPGRGSKSVHACTRELQGYLRGGGGDLTLLTSKEAHKSFLFVFSPDYLLSCLSIDPIKSKFSSTHFSCAGPNNLSANNDNHWTVKRLMPNVGEIPEHFSWTPPPLTPSHCLGLSDSLTCSL